MQTLTQLVHQAHYCRWNESQLLRKKPHALCQKYQQLSKSLVFLHGLALDFVELDFEEFDIVGDVVFVEDGVVGHFDGNFL